LAGIAVGGLALIDERGGAIVLRYSRRERRATALGWSVRDTRSFMHVKVVIIGGLLELRQL